MGKVESFYTEREIKQYKRLILFSVFILVPFLLSIWIFISFLRLIRFLLSLLIPIKIKFVEIDES